MAHPQTTPAEVNAILAEAQGRIDRLRAIEPYLIDLSMRENPVGARMGQTLDDKLRILPKLREFGCRHIHLGTLDYEFPDELETGDDFMASLRDRKVDTSGRSASTIRLMRRDLRALRRVVYDDRENLLELHPRALGACATAFHPDHHAQRCEQADI